MPLDEEGAKWSCEPCIRGHRSSKCQHFDRLMMKVPKAGRPLAKCPHPKGSCSCQKLYAFMVRIPKGSTCLCRPLYKVPMSSGSGNQISSDQVQPDQTPAHQTPQPKPSPPGPQPSSAPGLGRVQKRSRRQNSLQSTPESLAKGLSTISATPDHVKLEGLNSPNPNSLSPLSETYTEGHQPNMISNTGINGKGPIISEAQQSTPIPSASQSRGGCCSARPPPTNIPPPPSSCCSKKRNPGNNTSPVKNNAVNDTAPGPVLQSHSPAGTNYPSTYPRPQLQHKSFSTTSISNQTTAFDSPQVLNPTLTRYEQPAFSSAPTTGFPSPTLAHQYNNFDQYTLPQNLSAGMGGAINQSFPDTLRESGHNCGCGEGCQCVGCASHPFNDTTRQYIQEMGHMMALGQGDQGIDNSIDMGSSVFDTSNIPTNVHHPNFAFGGSEPSGMQGYIHGAQSQTLSGYGNGPSIAGPAHYESNNNDMMMRPAAYYTVEYPVSMLDPCSNIMGTCQCGVNCKCVGCLTHDGHNGIDLEPSPPPEEANVNVFNSNVGPPRVNSSFQQLQMQTSSPNDYTEYYSSPVVADPPPGCCVKRN